MTRAIVPKTMDYGEGFEMDRSKGEEGFGEGKCGVDDEMKGYYRNPRFLMKPLEVMLRSYLEGSGFCEREICSRMIERAMM